MKYCFKQKISKMYVLFICVLISCISCYRLHRCGDSLEGISKWNGSMLQEAGSVEELSQEVLRLHILANSDTDYDQKLKLEVKNAVASTVAADMRQCGIRCKKEAVEYMEENSDRYIDIAKSIVESEGYDYNVTATIGKHWFPVKAYGNALYPAGEYDAYRMLIGSAEGRNWWCVLFPSLCMVDEVCHVDDEAYNVEKEMFEEEAKEKTDEKDIHYKFRIVEWFRDMW